MSSCNMRFIKLSIVDIVKYRWSVLDTKLIKKRLAPQNEMSRCSEISLLGDQLIGTETNQKCHLSCETISDMCLNAAQTPRTWEFMNLSAMFASEPIGSYANAIHLVMTSERIKFHINSVPTNPKNTKSIWIHFWWWKRLLSSHNSKAILSTAR